MAGYFIPNDHLFFSIEELKENFSYYQINKMVDEGKLEKVNKKFYRNILFDGNENEYDFLQAFAPEGVVCLLSAASYYGLSNFRSDSIDIAIPRKAKVTTLPKWPDVHLHYYTELRYGVGVNTIKNENGIFKIYDKEKTIVDIVYYREKIGIDECKSILKKYLSQNDANINQLIRYSQKLNCYDVFQRYLEVLL